MAGESDVLIQSMNTRINELSRQADNHREEARRYQTEKKAHAALKAAHEALTKDRDAWKAKAEAAPSELQGKLDDALGQIRARDHRDAWHAALGDQLNDGVPIEDIWGKLKYSPGEAVPTPEQIREQAKAAQAAAPYLFKTPGATPTTGPNGAKASVTPPPLVTPVTPSRGAPDTAARRFEVRKSQTRDPGWMKDNYQAMTEARKAGTLTFVDD